MLLGAAEEDEKSLDTLATYLAYSARNDREKAHAIYRWITDRIGYDAANYFAGRRGDNTAEGVLKSRKAVCAGYANLYEQLARRAGLEVVQVIGCGKNNGQTLQSARSNHAWNAVRLDGRWQLLDATWGAGNVDHATRKFTRQYKPYYFSVCPEELAFSHFPADPRWQLLDKPVKESDFCRWPKVSLSPFVLGFQAADVCARLQDSSPRPLVETFACPGPRIRICSAPLEGKLRAGTRCHFRFESPGLEQMAIVMGRRPQPLERVGTDFQCSGGPKGTPGRRLSLAQCWASGQVVVCGLLRYQVE